MKKRLVLVVVLALGVVLAMAVPAFAVPVQNKMVVNVTWRQTNTWAWSPNVGVWGLADVMMNVQVRQTGSNSFTQIATIMGIWRTFAGAPSPGAGILQKHKGSGIVYARSTVTFSAPGLDPQDNLPVRGYIGTIDAGGTKDDIGPSLGPSPPGAFDFRGHYFPGSGDLNMVSLTQFYFYGPQTFEFHLETPGWPPVIGGTGDIVIR